VLDRIKSLEKELENSKSECLRLQHELTTAENVTKPADTMIGSRPTANVDCDARSLSKDSVIVANHLQQLNSVIGNLRAEKLDLMTQLRKQQLRITHLENLVDQLSKQVDSCSVRVLRICATFLRRVIFLNGASACASESRNNDALPP